MARKTLQQLYAEHDGLVSDKWESYLATYERVATDYRASPVRLLEIGVQNGGSLELWAKYFPRGRLFIGCDINPLCAGLAYEDPRVHVVVGDANSDQAFHQIVTISPEFDLVIDDGSHRSSDIVKSFARYFPRVADGGVFVAEDLHCSYWQEFEGGLYHPWSSMAFFKRLADVIQHEHWGTGRLNTSPLEGFFDRYGCRIDGEELRRIKSIEFSNSLCIIRKGGEALRGLGGRTIAGMVEQVELGILELSRHPIPAPDQSGNAWASLDTPPDEERPQLVKRLADSEELIAGNQVVLSEQVARIAVLERHLEERDGQIAERDRQVAERDGQIAERDRQVAERDGQIVERDRQVAERDGQIVERDRQISERDRRIATLDERLAEREKQISAESGRIIELGKEINALGFALEEQRARGEGLREELGKREMLIRESREEMERSRAEMAIRAVDYQGQVEALRMALAERESHIQSMLNSTSWRFAAPVRMLGRALAGVRRWLR